MIADTVGGMSADTVKRKLLVLVTAGLIRRARVGPGAYVWSVPGPQVVDFAPAKSTLARAESTLAGAKPPPREGKTTPHERERLIYLSGEGSMPSDSETTTDAHAALCAAHGVAGLEAEALRAYPLEQVRAALVTAKDKARINAGGYARACLERQQAEAQPVYAPDAQRVPTTDYSAWMDHTDSKTPKASPDDPLPDPTPPPPAPAPLPPAADVSTAIRDEWRHATRMLSIHMRTDYDRLLRHARLVNHIATDNGEIFTVAVRSVSAATELAGRWGRFVRRYTSDAVGREVNVRFTGGDG